MNFLIDDQIDAIIENENELSIINIRVLNKHKKKSRKTQFINISKKR